MKGLVAGLILAALPDMLFGDRQVPSKRRNGFKVNLERNGTAFPGLQHNGRAPIRTDERFRVSHGQSR